MTILQATKLIDNVVDTEKDNYAPADGGGGEQERDGRENNILNLNTMGVKVVNEEEGSEDERENGGEEKKEEIGDELSNLRLGSPMSSRLVPSESLRLNTNAGKVSSAGGSISKATAARLSEIALKRRLARQRDEASSVASATRSISSKMTKNQIAKMSAVKGVEMDFDFDNFVAGRTNKDGPNSPMHKSRLFEAASTIKKENSVLRMLQDFHKY